jgi:serine/threonine protein kinase
MLSAGTKIGAYEIAAEIGKGGMGEVCRARDAKLGRDVAIKVLPASFARDAERMARFEREAKVLASLNHPNIAAIYGFEDSGPEGSGHALVMELVEGPTLAERQLGILARERPAFSCAIRPRTRWRHRDPACAEASRRSDPCQPPCSGLCPRPWRWRSWQ